MSSTILIMNVDFLRFHLDLLHGCVLNSFLTIWQLCDTNWQFLNRLEVVRILAFKLKLHTSSGVYSSICNEQHLAGLDHMMQSHFSVMLLRTG